MKRKERCDTSSAIVFIRGEGNDWTDVAYEVDDFQAFLDAITQKRWLRVVIPDTIKAMPVGSTMLINSAKIATVVKLSSTDRSSVKYVLRLVIYEEGA